MNPELKLLFPSVVQIYDVPEHQSLDARMLDAVASVRAEIPNSKPRSWACDVYTTIGVPDAVLGHPTFDEFLTIAHENVVAFATALKLDVERQPPRIHECWINAYASDQSQEIHLHRNSVFSGIYYLQVPDGSGATLFYSPSADVMLEPPATEGDALNAKVTGFVPQAGRMLVFRSHLRHSVMPGCIEGERISIAFNAIM